MIETDCTGGVDATQVVVVRHVVAILGNYVKWRVKKFGRPEFTEELVHLLDWLVAVLASRDGRRGATSQYWLKVTTEGGLNR